MGRKRKNTRTEGGEHRRHSQHLQVAIDEDPLTIKSSWFGDDEVKWFSRHDDKSNCCSLQDYPSCNNGGARKSGGGDCVTVGAQPTPSTRHQCLTSELNQLKRQLMPAAKSCADAINDMSYGSNNVAPPSSPTTPQYEFRQARSICNPYERLGENVIRSSNHRHYCYSKQQQSSFRFVNRSAIKLANIDALLGFILTTTRPRQATKPITTSSSTTTTTTTVEVEEDDYFAFADLCGAPGGFSEYLLYRHVHPPPTHHRGEQNGTYANFHSAGTDGAECLDLAKPCYGFGMSLSGRNDEGKGVQWNLNHMAKHYHLQINEDSRNNNNNNATAKTCDNNDDDNNDGDITNGKNLLQHHVCHGIDGTGSIYNWDNVLELQRQISIRLPRRNYDKINAKNNESESAIHGQVHLVVADGGFDAQRDADNQEVLAQHIVVSQAAAALTLLRQGGIFVVKTFGFHEETTKRMLRYMHGCFDKITFVKPISSRPASAERYLVCCGYDGASGNWDGLAWKRQQMEMVFPELQDEGYECTPPSLLDNAANAFDLEMLKLNVESCRSILDYLHQKRDGKQKRNNKMFTSVGSSAVQLSRN